MDENCGSRRIEKEKIKWKRKKERKKKISAWSLIILIFLAMIYIHDLMYLRSYVLQNDREIRK